MNSERNVIASVEGEFKRYKTLAEKTIAQLEQEKLAERPTPESLSIAMLGWHISGNLTSRFTDFLTTDGEKPWRERDTEFEVREVSRGELLEKWEVGWGVMFDALAPLSDEDLGRSVTIRGFSLSIAEALQRALGHVSYHVGQITYLGKMLRGEKWEYLSIPPGGSIPYNQDPTLEKGPA